MSITVPLISKPLELAQVIHDEIKGGKVGAVVPAATIKWTFDECGPGGPGSGDRRFPQPLSDWAKANGMRYEYDFEEKIYVFSRREPAA